MRPPCRRLSLLVLLALLGGSPFALAQDPPGEEDRAGGLDLHRVEIRADEVRYEHERSLYEALGNVHVRHESGRELTADWLSINRETESGVAVGNVVIRDGDDVIQADFAAVDLRTLSVTTTVVDVQTAVGPRVTGQVIQHAGGGAYRVEQGTITTCQCPPGTAPDPWRLDVDEADVKVGGYAVARGVTMRVLDVPVFYTPWLIFPVKTERQTGLLLPSFGNSSRGGTELEIPFFWALRPNLNLLLRPKYFGDRGLKSAAELEYVFGERTWGSAGGALLPDDDEVDKDPDKRFSDNRGAWWWRHEQPLGDGLRFGTDITRISDNNYPLDFEDLADEARHDRFLESQAWLTFARGGLYAGLETAFQDDLQSPDDLDRDDFFLQRLADLKLSVLPTELGWGPLQGSLDARYTYFHQEADTGLVSGVAPVRGLFFDTGIDGLFTVAEEGPIADPHRDNGISEGDLRFQEGELLADHGHRADLYPRIALPWRFGWIETLSELGYRATIYSPDRGSTATRSLVTGRFEARAHLAKDILLVGRSLRHVIEPRLAFAFISDQNQDRNPLFIPEAKLRSNRLIDGDLRVLLRNPSDRIREEKLLLASIGNRFYTRGRGGPRLIGSFRLGAGYDFEESEPANIFMAGFFHPHENLSLRANAGYDTGDTRLSEVDLNLQWRSDPIYTLRSSTTDRRHELLLRYRYLRDLPETFEAFSRRDDVFDEFERGLDRINQFSLEGTWALRRQVDVFATGYLSIDESSTSGGRLGLAFLSACACWELIASIERRTRPDDTRFSLELRLAGLGFQPLVDRPRSLRTSPRPVDANAPLWDPAAP